MSSYEPSNTSSPSTAARTSGGAAYAHLQVEGTDSPGAEILVIRNSNDSYSSTLGLVKTRGTSDGAVTTVQDNDSLGTIQFRGADGSDIYSVAASITGEVDGSPSDGTDMPGALVFGTTADGSSSPTERVRITSSGLMGVGTNSPSDNIHISESGATNNYIRFSNSNISNGWSVGAQSGGRFQIVQNGVADRFFIESDGNITVNSGNLIMGTSGKGIDFSAAGNASGMTSELLDDYEEGTWTPAVQFDVGGSGITYGSRGGTYVKVGRMVHLQYYMHVSGGVSSSDYFARLTLPFSGIAVVHQDARIRQYNNTISDWFVSLGGSGPVFYENNNLGNSASWARGDNVNGVVLSGQYTLYVS